MATITIIDDDRTTDVEATRDGELLLVAPDAFARATGWTLKPEGLCQGDVCVPLRNAPDVAADGTINVARAGEVLQRTVIVDAAAGVVAYGAGVRAVSDALHDLRAPDFTLPQLDGTPFTFSAIGRKKKLLLAWASW